MNRLARSQKGFTLLEILLVVAALAILAGIVVFAINPSRQLKLTRDAQRKVDINTVLNAVYQYNIDNGTFPGPGALTTTAQDICRTGAADCTGFIDLSDLTANSTYIPSFPIDPLEPATVAGTGYTILKTANNRITVTATLAENGTIQATR